jgi:hypothetical protein
MSVSPNKLCALSRTFDLIVGDFGRPGTIRYYQAFSDAERELLVPLLDGKPFLDEHRRVRYIILGDLPSIKLDVILQSIEQCGEIDSRVLIGTKSGAPLSAIEDGLLAVLLPWLHTMRQLTYPDERLRIIIPCNTLSPLAEKIGNLLNGPDEGITGPLSGTFAKFREFARELPDVSLSIHAVVPTVAAAVIAGGFTSLQFIGTPAAHTAYLRKFEQLGYAIELNHVGEEEFARIYSGSIEGAHRGVKLSLTRPCLVGCTDISVLGGIDSVSTFARQMARDAYVSSASADTVPMNFETLFLCA